MSSANPTLPDRSELLRQRRTQRSGQRTSRSGLMARKPVKSQPVMVRNVSAPSLKPVAARRVGRKTQPRRQFYYSLGATGAELRLPALPIVNPGWRLLSGLLAVVFCLSLYMLWNDARFVIEDVDIAGLQRLDPADVAAVMDVRNLSIIEIHPAQIADQLSLAFPELMDIEVGIAFPAAVGVSATERQPKISWHNGDQVYWIDPEGMVIPPRGELAESLVAITANSQPPLIALPLPAETDAAKGGKPGKAIPVTSEPIWGRQVDPAFLKATEELRPYIPAESNLVYNSASGLGWTDPRGWQVFIGQTLANIDQKLVVYQSVVDALGQRGIIPSMISVEHVHAPFYRTEQ